MQKLFQNKNITQKIIIALVIVILFNFISPCVVQATDYNIIADGLAWVLVRITDAVQWIMLFCLTGETTMLMGHAFWDGLQENRDNWRLELIEAETVVENLKLSAVTGAALVVNPFGAIPLAIKNISRWITNNGITGKKATIEWPQRHILAPEDIFTGNILITNINFFKDYTKRGEDAIASKASDLGSGENAILDFSSEGEAANLEKLRKAIAKWYIAIRNIAIVGLLSVLVYVAIRMVISVASSDKAKYQKMLTDWLVALCLVFSMHYIMAITIGVCERLTELMNKQINSGVYMEYGDAFKFDKDNDYGYDATQHEKLDNLAMKVRIYTRSSNSTKALSYAFMYVAITAWTLVYFAIYIKRFVYMAFYTLMAPIVALTYPLDKIGDGRSQAFDGWLKEYIYTALKQPFHLLLYMVFIGMAQEIASSNIIYTIVVLWAMAQLDGTLAKWIGVDQASSTGSTVKDAFGSLMQIQAVQSLANGISNRGNSKAGDAKESGDKSPSVRTKESKNNYSTPDSDLIGDSENIEASDNPGTSGQNPSQQGATPGNMQNNPNTSSSSRTTTSSSQANRNATRTSSGQTAGNGNYNNVYAKKTSNKKEHPKLDKLKNTKPIKAIKYAGYRAGRGIENGAKKAVKNAPRTMGNALRAATKLTLATGAMFAGGGAQGAVSVMNLTDAGFDKIEKGVQYGKGKVDGAVEFFKDMEYEVSTEEERKADKRESELKQIRKELKDATPEQRRKVKEALGDIDMDQAMEYVRMSGGRYDILEDPKQIAHDMQNASDMCNQLGISPNLGLKYMAEGNRYMDMGYSQKDAETVKQMIDRSGYKNPDHIYEAFLLAVNPGRKFDKDQMGQL